MGISIQWDNDEKTLIYVHATANRSLTEAYEAIRQINELVAEVPHPVDIIVYIEKTIRLSPNYSYHFQQLADGFHPRVRRIAAVSPDLFTMDLMRLQEASHIPAVVEFKTLPTLEQARLWLESGGDDGFDPFRAN